jgi:pimeloyl-ACP methyl ester carboxylesterase
MEDFDGFLPELIRKFQLIGIDSRGQGKSTPGSTSLTYEQIQKDVPRMPAHLQIDNLSIIGFSDGGITAYRLACLTSIAWHWPSSGCGWTRIHPVIRMKP